MPREDLLLGGRLRLAQPESGYRTAIDPVLLAAAVAARPGERVLDLGAGVGGASLCLAARLTQVLAIGVERETSFHRLAVENAAANGMADRVDFRLGDVLAPPPDLPGCDQAMMNPPYLKAEAASHQPDPLKAAATIEGAAKLADWVACAASRLAQGGRLTVVHRADRLADLLAALAPAFGGVRLLPVQPRQGEGARRILLGAVKGSAAPLVFLPPLVLHAADGAYTPEAQAILAEAAPIALWPAG